MATLIIWTRLAGLVGGSSDIQPVIIRTAPGGTCLIPGWELDRLEQLAFRTILADGPGTPHCYVKVTIGTATDKEGLSHSSKINANSRELTRRPCHLVHRSCLSGR